MLKQKIKNRVGSLLPIIIMVLALSGSTLYSGLVSADQYDEQIRALQRQNSASQQVSDQLASKANSYQDAINKLSMRINNLQQSIVSNQKQSNKLQAQIDAHQKELDHQRQVLGQNIKTMYLEGQTSTLEILASSNNISDFVNKETYRNTVQNQIKRTVDKIDSLKQQLQSKQQEIQQLIKSQQAQRNQLASAESQQSQMLAYTEGQKSAYDQQIKSNLSQISSLRAQQAAENARLFSGANIVLGSACDSGHGDTYPSPWCSSPQDSMLDSWGMFNRECVSYTAWKVSESGRYMPYWGGYGNANQWDDNAIAAGIPVSSRPRAGDVAIKNSMPYGHAMYVESVNSDGTINISQYNASLNGQFSRVYNLSASGLVFIHFP